MIPSKDPKILEAVYKEYPHENIRRKVGRKKIFKIIEDSTNYGYLDAFDDIIEKIKDPELVNKDEILGELHLLAKARLDSMPLRNYKQLSMRSLEWIIDFFEQAKT